MMQLPGPPTHPTDWLPDPLPSRRIYQPKKPVYGTRAKRSERIGRPRGGRHSERRRAQWRAYKERVRGAA